MQLNEKPSHAQHGRSTYILYLTVGMNQTFKSKESHTSYFQNKLLMSNPHTSSHRYIFLHNAISNICKIDKSGLLDFIL